MAVKRDGAKRRIMAKKYAVTTSTCAIIILKKPLCEVKKDENKIKDDLLER